MITSPSYTGAPFTRSRISPEGEAALTWPVTSVAVPAAVATAPGAAAAGDIAGGTGAGAAPAAAASNTPVAANERLRTMLFMLLISLMAGAASIGALADGAARGTGVRVFAARRMVLAGRVVVVGRVGVDLARGRRRQGRSQQRFHGADQAGAGDVVQPGDRARGVDDQVAAADVEGARVPQ